MKLSAVVIANIVASAFATSAEADATPRDLLAQALEAAGAVTGMSEAELQEAPLNIHTSLFSLFDEHPSESINDHGFWRVSDRTIGGPAFGAAWRAVATAGSTADACDNLISSFLVSRPHWFTASRSEVVLLRECVELGLTLAGTDETAEAYNLVMRVLTDLVVPAFSPRSELAVRFPHSLLDSETVMARKTEFKFFQQFIAESSVIKTLLEETAETADASALVVDKWEDARMAILVMSGSAGANLLPGSAGNLVHAGHWLDRVWAHNAAQGHGGATLQLWQALAESVVDFDEQELAFEAANRVVVASPGREYSDRITHHESGMGAARWAWVNTVSGLLGHLEAQPAMRVCMTEAGLEEISPAAWYELEGKLATTMRFYNCVVDGVAAGELVIGESEHKPSNVAALMHLVRMTHGALAFLVTATA
jgi:hypothetical protein